MAPISRRGARGQRNSRSGHRPNSGPSAFLGQVLTLQRDAGNRAVTELLKGHGAVIQRSTTGSSVWEEHRLAGHPLVVQRTAPNLHVNVSLERADPKPVKRPQADIVKDHGEPRAVGWTTPYYKPELVRREDTLLMVNVKYGCEIEFSEKLTAEELPVLMDHEQGHVAIVDKAAKQHLELGMEQALRFLPDFTDPERINDKIDVATYFFRSQESSEGRKYDAADYPRMADAFTDSKVPLRHLQRGRPDVTALVSTLRAAVRAGGDEGAAARLVTSRPATVMGLLDAVATRALMITEPDARLLQYNAAFKALHSQAEAAIKNLRKAVPADDMEFGPMLDNVDSMMRRFVHDPNVVLIGLGILPPTS